VVYLPLCIRCTSPASLYTNEFTVVLKQTGLPFSAGIGFAMHCVSNACATCFGNSVNFNMTSSESKKAKSVSTEERERERERERDYFQNQERMWNLHVYFTYFPGL